PPRGEGCLPPQRGRDRDHRPCRIPWGRRRPTQDWQGRLSWIQDVRDAAHAGLRPVAPDPQQEFEHPRYGSPGDSLNEIAVAFQAPPLGRQGSRGSASSAKTSNRCSPALAVQLQATPAQLFDTSRWALRFNPPEQMDFEPFPQIMDWNSSPTCQRKSNLERCFCDDSQPGDRDSSSLLT